MLAAENVPCDAVTTVLVRPTSAYALANMGGDLEMALEAFTEVNLQSSS